MHAIHDRRRRSPHSAVPHSEARNLGGPGGLEAAGEEWITFLGHGSGFDDCPLCRELASQPGGAEAFVSVRVASLPELARAGWLDDLLELVGRDATVRVIGRDMEAEPLEELSMATFLARLGYD